MFGLLAYRVYYETFERRGSDAGVRGIAFFFGVAFVIEVAHHPQFGVDQRTVQAPYIGKSIASATCASRCACSSPLSSR